MAERPPSSGKRDRAGRFLRHATTSGAARGPGGHWHPRGVRDWECPAPASPFLTEPVIVAEGCRAPAMDGPPEKGDRDREGGAPPALSGPGAGGDGMRTRGGAPAGPARGSRPAWRRPPNGTGMRIGDAPQAAHGAAGGMAAAGPSRNCGRQRAPTSHGLQRIRPALALVEGVASRLVSAWDRAMQCVGMLEGIVPDEGSGDLTLVEFRARCALLFAVGKFCLSRALRRGSKRSFPSMASGAVARTPDKKADAKLMKTSLVSKGLDCFQSFDARAVYMGSKSMFTEITAATTDSEAASGHLDFEKSIETIADVAKRYRDHVHGVNVEVEAPREPRVGARAGSPARHDALAPIRLLAEPPPAKDSRMLDVIMLFLLFRRLLSIWQIVDGNVLQELVAYALQLALVLLERLAG